MTSLLPKLEEKLAFDENWSEEASRSIENGPIDNSFVEGCRYENNRLKPYHQALLKCVEILEHECCCPGELSWVTNKEILCDPCEALQHLREVIEK